MHATFCFVDIAGFSALTEAHGDDAGADMALRLSALVAELLERDGLVVDEVGDAVFFTAQEPRAAVGFVRRLWSRADEEALFPALRAGLHHGEAVRRGERFFGTAVNVAARVAAEARGGQVLATAAVAAAARIEGIGVTSLGQFSLRNIRDSVELFALSLGGETKSETLDPVCRMRVSPERAAGHLQVDGRDYWFCSLHCAGLFAADPKAYRLT